MQVGSITSRPEPRRRRWTRVEYYQMAERGWFQGQRLELIGGNILEMNPQKNSHFVSVSLVDGVLRSVFGAEFWIRVQGPLSVSSTSEPEPDIAVVPGKPRDYTNHPTSALLVVEVSDTTLAFDQGEKASLYASAGVADYWIVNLVDRQLEVHRNPVSDGAQPYGFGYADKPILTPAQSVAPLAAIQSPVRVANLLP